MENEQWSKLVAQSRRLTELMEGIKSTVTKNPQSKASDHQNFKEVKAALKELTNMLDLIEANESMPSLGIDTSNKFDIEQITSNIVQGLNLPLKKLVHLTHKNSGNGRRVSVIKEKVFGSNVKILEMNIISPENSITTYEDGGREVLGKEYNAFVETAVKLITKYAGSEPRIIES